MRLHLRRWLPWAVLLALIAGAWFGWVQLRRAFVVWASQEHRVGGWTIQAIGGSIVSLETVRADSILVSGPAARLVVRNPELSWFRHLGAPAHRFPFLLELRVGSLKVDLQPSPERRNPAPPAFPSSIRLPVALRAVVGNLVVRRDSTIDLRLRDLDAASVGEAGFVASWGSLRWGRIPAEASGELDLDWRRDSVRGGVRTLLSSGCCARDSLSLEVARPFANLLLGRAAIRARVASLASWNEVLPALVRVPRVEDIRLDAQVVQAAGGVPGARVQASFSSDTVLFLPGMRWSIEAVTDSANSDLRVLARGREGVSLKVDLAADTDLRTALEHDRFSGKVGVRGIGFDLANQPHPFDGEVDVQSLGLVGGEGVARLASGSVVRGGAVWKGLHWHLDGQIAAAEPWAVAWVPGLGLDGARVTGRDTVGAALFRVMGQRARYQAIESDSMEVGVKLALDHIRFPKIRLWKADKSWSGNGHVSWKKTEQGYAFALAPDSGEGMARVEGDFLGRVWADLESFPTDGLPISDPRAHLPYPISVTGRFERLPPTRTDSASMSLSARLLARPAGDSLELVVDAFQKGPIAEVVSARATLGGAVVDAGLQARKDAAGWRLDGLRASFTEVDLQRFATIWPGLPLLRGRLEGALAMSRDEGVSANARLKGLALSSDQGWTTLPDLVVWGERDTLHVGGHWPVDGHQDPFRLTLSGIFERDLAFRLLAFHGDVVRLKGQGVVQDRKRLQADLVAEGGIAIPGTEARLDDILVVGQVRGEKGEKSFDWNATLEGREGVLRALKGLPLRSRFFVRADAGAVHLDSLSLRGDRAGELDFRGRFDLATKVLVGKGKARDFRLDLGEGKQFRLGAMDLSAGADQKLRAQVSDLSWQQTWGTKGGLWIDVDKAQLALVQAKDWRKLEGQVQVEKLLFTRDLADPKSLLASAGDALTGASAADARTASRTRQASIPFLLDLRVWGGGDSVRVRNNLAQASLAFDLQATGPMDAMLLNGTLDADPEGASFGYLGKTFRLEEFHAEWNVAPPLSGKYTLEGARPILQTCPDALERDRNGAVATTSTDSCNLKLSSEGTLSEPRLRPLTSDCGSGGADEGAVQAAIALARDCYPQETGSGNTSIGGAARSTAIDIGVQLGVGQVNDVLRKQLLRQREGGKVFLPDSVAVTDVPVGGARDQLGLLALYRLSDHLDAEGEYRHTFVQTSTARGSAVTTLADDYSLRLRWRPPLMWIEESRIQQRLRDHLVFQVELGQGLDERSQRETTIRPSIRYRWEFW